MFRSGSFNLHAVWLLVGAVFYIATPAIAAETPGECLQQSPHQAVTFVLIDRSDSISETEGFRQSLAAAAKMIKPAERLVAGVITDKLSTTRLVVDVVKPEESLWESKLAFRKKQKIFGDCLKFLETSMLSQKESYKTSAILETLGFVSQVLKADASPQKRLVIYSDMVQNSETLTFYRQKNLDAGQVLERARKEALLKEFNGVDFYIAGVGGSVTDREARAVEAFWRSYVQEARGQLQFYGPVLVLP